MWSISERALSCMEIAKMSTLVTSGDLQNIPLAGKSGFVTSVLYLMLPACWQRHMRKKTIAPWFLQKPAEQFACLSDQQSCHIWCLGTHRTKAIPRGVLHSAFPVLVVLQCLTMSCPSQIGSCCPTGPGRWGKCLLVPSPYCGEPNASRLLQWHTDNITGKLGTLASSWSVTWWFNSKCLKASSQLPLCLICPWESEPTLQSLSLQRCCRLESTKFLHTQEQQNWSLSTRKLGTTPK